MSFIRKIKKIATHLAEVENDREGSKVKQRVIRYIGKEVNGQVVRKITSEGIEVESVKQYLDYKELKSSITLHQIRKYRMSHIKAHVKICYMAYALLTFIQYKLRQKNLSAVEALERLQSAYKVYLKSEKERFTCSKI